MSVTQPTSDDTTVREYAEAGASFGHMASLAPLIGLCVGFYEQLDELVAAEVKYVRQHLAEGEMPVFHARDLRGRLREAREAHEVR